MSLPELAEASTPTSHHAAATRAWLSGWDATPGIVSVWADWSGQALVWRRVEGRVVCERERFTPWVFARDLADVEHLGERVREHDAAAPVWYTRLRGERGQLRFLLRARDGQLLRRAILRGASKRLEQSVRGLSDLDGYYSVGPVEQYLMLTGRTFFGGLVFDDLHRLQFDLETTSLEPSQGRIFLVAVRDNRGFEAVLEAPSETDEQRLIRDLVQLVRTRDPDVIENHNLMRFDLPFLLGRAQAHGLSLDLGRLPGPRGVWRVPDGRSSPHFACAGRELLDTYDAALRHDVESRGLKALARAFGVAEPDRVYLEGAEIARTYQQDPQLVRRYALQDVAEVAALAERLLAPFFALAQMAPRSYARLPYAGPATGVLEPMLVRAYLRAGVALPGDQPGDGGVHQGGALHLYARGVLPRVVKADIASLYPSLMRAYRIGSGNDPLGVLWHLVDQLTALRLHHKRAAKNAESGSRAAGEHEATQVAMKLVINAAYGYLGAGKLALFGDRAAADEITRRGRDVLATVIAGLGAQGVTLIEADTDGVYFSVPEDWNEARERGAVRAVAASLPSGVQLEFEGRYAAMLSHEVKNYALLTHDGQLVRRGAAFRSIRAEPFGERFLEQALRCLLTGDVAGVRAAHAETVRQLRARELPPADVAVRARLTKSPAAYAAARRAKREGPYEALLASGRSAWAVGERIRYYRRQDGTFALVQDARGPDYDAGHYVELLTASYASRLRTAFSPEHFAQLFRADAQGGLFDVPLHDVRIRWTALSPTSSYSPTSS